MKEPEIIFEDDDIIVCYKKAGIATQTKRLGQQDMETLLKNYRARKKEKPYIGVVHRLDQPVEGVMVFAKNQRAAAELSKQVQNRSIGKHYLAVGETGEKTSDKALADKGTLTDYMVYDQRQNLGRIVSKETPLAKKAVLEYQVMEEKESKVKFDIRLRTGRHHQIRLQMSNMGYPLIGDQKYGEKVDQIQAKRNVALCAYKLEFRHPSSGKNMIFEIEPRNPEFTL